jgi:hypothetical protein
MSDLKKYYKYYTKLNNSKLLAGLAMIILNLFSKYVELKLTKNQEEYLRNTIGREILIFTVVFVGTHDIIISILMTAAFLILSNTAFNENSRLCVMPAKYKNLHNVLDTNHDNYISDKEIEKARDILYQANIQRNKLAQL